MAIFSGKDVFVRRVTLLSQFYQLTPEEIDKWALLMEPVFGERSMDPIATWDAIRAGSLNYSQGHQTRCEELQPLRKLHTATRLLMDYAAKREGSLEQVQEATQVINAILAETNRPASFLTVNEEQTISPFRVSSFSGSGIKRLIWKLTDELIVTLPKPAVFSICGVCGSVYIGTGREKSCSLRCRERVAKRRHRRKE